MMKAFYSIALLWVCTAWAGSTMKIELETGTSKDREAMVFSKDRLAAKAGTKVTLTFKNNAVSKGAVRNFVLTKPGKAQNVIDASVAAGPEKGWIGDNADIIVKGKLVDAGESETLDFTVPSEPGDYPYICTFPGHAAMRGIMKVTR